MHLQDNTATDNTLSKFSPDWLRSFKGCADYNDEQAIEIITSLSSLVKIFIHNLNNTNH